MSTTSFAVLIITTATIFYNIGYYRAMKYAMRKMDELLDKE